MNWRQGTGDWSGSRFYHDAEFNRFSGIGYGNRNGSGLSMRRCGSFSNFGNFENFGSDRNQMWDQRRFENYQGL